MKSMESKDNDKSQPSMACEPCEGPRYPYGLRICLNQESIEALGISKMPQVGDVMNVMATAKVVSVSQSEMESGKMYGSIDLQIVEMGVEKKGKEKTADSSKLYK